MINGQFASTDDSWLQIQPEHACKRLHDGTHIQAAQNPLKNSDNVSISVFPGFTLIIEIAMSRSSDWKRINGSPTLLRNRRVFCFGKEWLNPFLK